jgi:hypothetical protein
MVLNSSGCRNGSCSWQYEYPDLDHRDDFDGPPIEMRSTRRTQSRFFGRKSKVGNADLMNLNPHDLEHDDEFEDGGEVGVIDRTPTKVSSEHFELRESLVMQFEIRYGKTLCIGFIILQKSANGCK